MSSLARNKAKTTGVSKHFSLRFHRNNRGLTKSNSCRSFRNESKDSYLNVSNESGRFVISDESTEPDEQNCPDETRNTTVRNSALKWARLKFSQFRESVRKQNTDGPRVSKVKERQEQDDSHEQDDITGTYATAEDCIPSVSAVCDDNLYSRKILPSKSASADDIHQSSRFQKIAQRFFVVRWMTTKILQFRDRYSNAPQRSRSVYEKARVILETSDDYSMTSSNAEEPVYMDASLGNIDEPKIEAEVARQSTVYFELEPDQRYEVVTLDNSTPVLKGSASKPSQYAKLGLHDKSERGNIYGDLSSAPLDTLKE